MLNAALSAAIQATAQELAATPFGWIDPMTKIASRALPTSMEGVPDLLTFGPIVKSEKWRKLKHNMHNTPALFEMSGRGTSSAGFDTDTPSYMCHP